VHAVITAARSERDRVLLHVLWVTGHLFRHARVRQVIRSTRCLPPAQRQAGWSRLQMASLTIGDEKAHDQRGKYPDGWFVG
jgi:hypothetical protein